MGDYIQFESTVSPKFIMLLLQGKTETSSEKTNHPSIVKVSPLKRDRPVTRNSKKDVLKKDEPTLKPQGKTGNNKILISPKKKSKQNLDCEIPANDSIQTSSTNQNSPTQMNLPNQNSETASTNHIQSSESSQQTKRSLKFDDGKSQKNENESNEIQVEGSDAKESTVNQPKESNSEETIEKSSSNDETQRSANSTCNDDCEKPEKASNVENKLHQKVKKLKPRRSKSVDLFGNQLDLHAESSDRKLTQHNRATKSRKGRKQKSIDDLSIGNSKVTDFYQYRRSDRRLGGKAWTKEDIYEKLVKENCQDGLKIVEFPGKGRGIVATKTFERNDFVVEYKGDLITPQEAKTREEKFENDPDVGCYMYYFVHGGIRYCIDATKVGFISKEKYWNFLKLLLERK